MPHVTSFPLSSPDDSRSDELVDLLLYDRILHVITKRGGISLRLLQDLMWKRQLAWTNED